MTDRDWGKDRSRQQMRRQGIDDISDQSARRVISSAPQRSGYGDVTAAARWLLQNRRRLRKEGKHVVPVLRAEFGISTKEACQAIKECNLMAAEVSGRIGR